MTTATNEQARYKPDDVDRRLLNELQAGVQLIEEPYAEVGERAGLSESEVLERVARLKDAGIIRQLSAIFDTRALGYESSLVAAAYPDDQLFEAASIIGGHPGVSHNYRRNHRFNLWFTLAVESGSEIGLQDTLRILEERTGAESMRSMPTLKLFKINVQLDMKGDRESTQKESPKAPPTRGDGRLPDENDKRFVQIMQRDLPVTSKPFDLWADEAGVTRDELLAEGETFRQRNYMRRFAGVLNHRKAGFGANGMAVWKVPEDEIETIGPKMAAFSAVSHCYKRPTYPDWPYSIFTMVHARSKELCEDTIAAIAEDVGYADPDQRSVLYSTYEFKKVRLVYFTPNYEEWEKTALAGDPLPRW